MDSLTAPVNTVLQVCLHELTLFIGYIQEIDPETKGVASVLVASKILNQLPGAFKSNPEMLEDLKEECRLAKNFLANNAHD